MSRATRVLALSLTVATGFAGLAYEVTWQRYLAALLEGARAEIERTLAGWRVSCAGGPRRSR